MKIKRIISLMIVIVLSLSMFINSNALDKMNGKLDNFVSLRAFSSFDDVPETSWYYKSIGLVYAYGLMDGTTSKTFYPEGKITLAETLALTARLHNIYYGERGQFRQGTPWYQVYVDYVLNNVLDEKDKYLVNQKRLSYPVTREVFVKLIAAAFSDDMYTVFPSINTLENIPNGIPDVAYTIENYPIYRLYYAGVLTGCDKLGSFCPNDNIKRGEASTILSRVIFPEERRNYYIKSLNNNYSYVEKTNFEYWINRASVIELCDNSVSSGFGTSNGKNYVFSNTQRFSNAVNSYSNTEVTTQMQLDFYTGKITFSSEFKTVSLGKTYKDSCIFTSGIKASSAKWSGNSQMISNHKKIAEDYTIDNACSIFEEMAYAIVRANGYNLSNEYGQYLLNRCSNRINYLVL